MEIEGTSEIVSVRHHIVEGKLTAVESSFVLEGVVVEGEEVNIPVADILRQYEGEDIRIVVVSLEEAERLLALAQGTLDVGRGS